MKEEKILQLLERLAEEYINRADLDLAEAMEKEFVMTNVIKSYLNYIKKSMALDVLYKVDKSRNQSLGGKGLGLALVKKIVNIHEGSVTMESALGTGTSFKVTLPIQE